MWSIHFFVFLFSCTLWISAIRNEAIHEIRDYCGVSTRVISVIHCCSSLKQGFLPNIRERLPEIIWFFHCLRMEIAQVVRRNRGRCLQQWMQQAAVCTKRLHNFAFDCAHAAKTGKIIDLGIELILQWWGIGFSMWSKADHYSTNNSIKMASSNV